MIEKYCSKCRKLFDQDDFDWTNRNRKNGGNWRAQCRLCRNEQARNSAQRLRIIDPGHGNQYRNEWRARNPEKAQAYWQKRWESNKAYFKAKANQRKAQKLQAIPKWLTKDQLKQITQFYINCPKGFHVDHIYPLRAKEAWGLHVLWNLQYLPAKENLKKGNRLEEVGAQ